MRSGIGTALGTRGFVDAKYPELVQARCGILVPGNELKMSALQRNPGEYQFEPAEKIVAFAQNHDMLARGHTLPWHHPRWLPKWLETYDFGSEPATATAELITGQMRETAFSRHIGAGNQDSNANRAFDARDEQAWRKFLQEVTGMGSRLVITEFDVHDAPLFADIRRRDRKVASLRRAPRADGLPKRPTPFDSHYRAKPLRDAIAAAFRAAPARRPAIPRGEPA